MKSIPKGMRKFYIILLSMLLLTSFSILCIFFLKGPGSEINGGAIAAVIGAFGTTLTTLLITIIAGYNSEYRNNPKIGEEEVK